MRRRSQKHTVSNSQIERDLASIFGDVNQVQSDVWEVVVQEDAREDGLVEFYKKDHTIEIVGRGGKRSILEMSSDEDVWNTAVQEMTKAMRKARNEPKISAMIFEQYMQDSIVKDLKVMRDPSKRSNIKNSLIRLGNTNPSLRKHIRPILDSLK